MPDDERPVVGEVWTVLKVLCWTTERFSQRRIASPRLDAEVLLAHSLAVERMRLYMDHDKPLAVEELARFRKLIQRRLSGEPVAYIVGQREFWSLPFFVGPEVLVPRPETELLVELALSALRAAPTATGRRVVDVGTGSGAIAVALAHELSELRVTAIDRHEAALGVARRNVERHGVAVQLVLGDLLAPLPEAPALDMIVANLPYVTTVEMQGLPPEVKQFEPSSALCGGHDGLELISRLVPQAQARLLPGGVLLLEIGASQGAAVRSLLTAAGFDDVSCHKDLAGLDRVVSGVA